jgi:hypothetical protein
MTCIRTKESDIDNLPKMEDTDNQPISFSK